MKKLLKQEWKFYTVAMLLLTVVLLGIQYGFSDWADDYFQEYIVDTIIQVIGNVSFYASRNIMVTVIAYCVVKCYQYWTERNRYGRAFLVTVPVKERTRTLFYLLADSMFVIVPNLLCQIGVYAGTVLVLKKYEVEMPWLASYILRPWVSGIVYLFMLIMISRFFESLIVNGVWKIVGAVAAAGLFLGCVMMSEILLTKNPNDTYAEVREYTWKFVSLDNREYLSFYESEEYEKLFKREEELIDLFLKESEQESGTVEDAASLPLEKLYHGEFGTGLSVYYRGEPIENMFYDLAEQTDYDGEKRTFDAAMDWIWYDTMMQNFVIRTEASISGVVWGNLFLAIVLFFLILWISDKREASATLFYFSFVKYLYATLIGLLIFFIGFGSATMVWHKAFVFFGAIAAAALCLKWMTPNQQAWFKRRWGKRA